ncbi:hypothetical protein VE01_05778 [Pseudogymnoascus verrucosus]|uniref:NACHT domain-containing protein n=1 Tax=Pseudogymnoascus verrucosus TaxID=342668 RepID=A0A1B8GKE9_9PEZI|nr:uncharacterized protein VE01_05778 [Pseudogymnoascus verrucosus]OBT96330.1 hypothetical protein VE01_05778 [Pseudogymnoascus verrucosus]
MQRGNDVVGDAVGNEDNSTSAGSGVPPAKAEPLIDILHEDVNAAVDIVAVHGLGANPDYAWVWLPKNNPRGNPSYPDTPLNWLRDLLPSKLLSSRLPCRVMTFNYDSKWFLKAPQQRLSNISDNLLNSLRNNREKAIDRPLIFIGHSFGGNLIEQAIISARLHPEYKHIVGSTVGVIFLGTPHRGSKAAKWGALIASVAGTFVSTEERILDDLQEQSGTLTDRLYEFSSWLFSESVPVVCYYEKLRTDYSTRAGPLRFIVKSMFKEVVVNETSACIDGHQKISLNTDHFKINKFYGPDDPSFRQVYPEIVRMAANAEEMLRRRRTPRAIPVAIPVAITDEQITTTKQLREFLQGMGVMNAQDVLSDIKHQKGERVGNTCEWILRRKEFSAWGASENPQLFCITGSPGIGKTMMSTFLVDELQKKVERAPSKALAYFFCDDKDQDRKTPIAILRSLIWQILLQRNELFDIIKPDFNAQGNTIAGNFSTLARILKGMLQDERAGEVFILIDALDECDGSLRKGLLSCIRELLQTSLTTQTGKFKFLVTSRPENDIMEELRGVGTRLLMNSTSVNYDLSMYIDSEVDRLAKRKGYTPELKQMVENALKNEAEGTFLWVSLMVADLEKEHRYNVKDKLKQLPKGLNETYTQILIKNVSNEAREDVQFLLLSMVAAQSPLKKHEIASAFAVWKDGRVLSRRHGDEYTDICLSCSSIIYLGVKGNDNYATINFCHQSVKDFLLDNHDGLQDAWYHTSRDRANLVLFQVCWNYLTSKTFNDRNWFASYESRHGFRCLIEKKHQDLHEHFLEYPLLQYATTKWEDHAIASSPALFDMFRISSGKEPAASYPNVLRQLTIEVADAPILRDAWLLRAAIEGHEGAVELLHEQKANLNIQDMNGKSPLSWAAECGKEATVRLLLDTGKVEADLRDEYSRTPLSWAAEKGHEAVARLLLSIGKAEVDLRDMAGRPPLSWAARGGHEAVARLLLDIGKAKADLRDISGRSPLSWAANNGHEDVTRLLLNTGDVEADLRDNLLRQSPLSLASKGGHEAVTSLLLNTGKVDANLRDENGRSPLSWAAGGGHVAVTRLLLETDKVEADLVDYDGRSPLSWAARGGHVAVTRLLLETDKVEADLADHDGRSPLSYAARNGHAAIIKLLLDTGEVEADKKDKEGLSPLWWAVDQSSERGGKDWGHTAVATLLLYTDKVEYVAGVEEMFQTWR